MTVNCYVLTTYVTDVVCALVADGMCSCLSLCATNVTCNIGTAAVNVCRNLTGYTTSVTISVTCVVVNVSSSRTGLATTLTGILATVTELMTGNLVTNVVTHVTCSVYAVIVYVTDNYTNIVTLVTSSIVTVIEYVEVMSRSIGNLGLGRLYLTAVDTLAINVYVAGNFTLSTTNVTIGVTYVVIYVVGYTDLTTLVTIGIASVVIYVIAVESKNVHDLLVYILMTSLGEVGDGRIENEVKNEVKERIVCTILEEGLIVGFSIADVYVCNVLGKKCVCEGLYRVDLCNVGVKCAKVNILAEYINLVVECIVLTKKNDGYVGVGLVEINDKLAVLVVECNVRVNVGLKSEYKRIYNRNCDGKVLCALKVLLKHSTLDGYTLVGDVIVRTEYAVKSIIKNRNLNSVVIHYALLNKLSADRVTKVVNVVEVILTNVLSPVKLLKRSVCKEAACKDCYETVVTHELIVLVRKLALADKCVYEAVDLTVNVLLLLRGIELDVTVLTKACVEAVNVCVDTSKYRIRISKTGVSDVIVNEFLNVAEELCYREGSKLACAVTDGYEVCACKEIIVKIAPNGALCGDLALCHIGKSCSKKLCIVVVAAAYGNVNGLLVRSELATDCIIYISCDCIVDELTKSVGAILKECIKSCCKVLCVIDFCLDKSLKLCLESLDLSCKLCLNSSDLSKDSISSCAYCGLELCVKDCKLLLSLCLKSLDLLIDLCGDSRDLLCNVCIELAKNGLDLNSDLSVKSCKSCLDLVDEVKSVYKVVNTVSDHGEKLAKKAEDLVKRSVDSLGSREVEVKAKVVVLNNSIEVNNDEIPNEVAVDLEPACDCGKNNVCVIKNEVKNVLAVGHAYVTDNCEDNLVIINNEVSDVIAVDGEEFDNLLGVIDKPIVSKLSCLVAVNCDSVYKSVNELLVGNGSLIVDVGVYVVYEVKGEVLCELNSLNGSVDCILNSLVELFYILNESCDVSLKLCLDLCDLVSKVLLKNCDLCKDCVSSLAYCGLKLLVKNVELVVNLSLKDLDLLVCLCLKLCNCNHKLLVGDSSKLDAKVSKVLCVSLKVCKKSVKSNESLGSDSLVIYKILDLNKSSVHKIKLSENILLRKLESLTNLSAVNYSICIANRLACKVDVVVKLIDYALLSKLGMYVSVDLLVVVSNVLSKDLCILNYILNSLIKCGVIALVSCDNLLSKSLVASGSGMYTHTVANLEETVDLAHTLNGCGCVLTGENVCKSGTKIRGMLKIHDAAHCLGAEHAHESLGRCNVLKTLNSNVGNLTGSGNCILNSECNSYGNVLSRIYGRNVSNNLIHIAGCESSVKTCIAVCCIISLVEAVFYEAVCYHLSLKNLKILNGNSRKIHTESCGKSISERVVVRFECTATNDLCGETELCVTCCLVPTKSCHVIEYLANELGVSLLSIVELNVLCLLKALKNGGETCDISIKKSEHLVHDVTEGDLLFADYKVEAVCSVHETDENDLCIGIELDDLLNGTLETKKEVCNGVSKKLCCVKNRILLCNVSRNVGVDVLNSLVIDLEYDLLLILVKLVYERLVKLINILVGSIAHNTDDTGESGDKERAEGCITYAESNDVCINNCVLEMLLKSCIIVTVGIVVNLFEPVVSGLLKTTKEVEEILCTKCGRSELGVLYIVTLILKVLLEEHRIRILAIDAIAAADEVKVVRTLLIAGEAIAVSHGIANGHIVDFLIFLMSVLSNLCSGANSSSGYAEQDSKNHHEGNEFETNLS